ncbi:hypothetical protein HUG17_0001 [Dermatophagoides farinae]|uniref:C2H2-type domain-containing protein n=2 Tax=Dermatophagoides farinae TaxID=6954 RepID=A0A9D4P5E2_DERFA|nr:hypothetical protein HUG17_0001 [Dermatophagoides farinae]
MALMELTTENATCFDITIFSRPKLHSRPKQNFVSSSLITRSAHIAIRQWPLTDHKLDEVFGKQEWFKNRNALQKYCESITIFSEYSTVIKLFGSTQNDDDNDALEIRFETMQKFIKSKYGRLCTQIASLWQQFRQHFHQQSTSSHQLNDNQISQSSEEYDSDTTIVDSLDDHHHTPADEIMITNDISEDKEPENNSSPNLEHIDCQQYKCDHCGYAAGSKDRLDEHIQQVQLI